MRKWSARTRDDIFVAVCDTAMNTDKFIIVIAYHDIFIITIFQPRNIILQWVIQIITVLQNFISQTHYISIICYAIDECYFRKMYQTIKEQLILHEIIDFLELNLIEDIKYKIYTFFVFSFMLFPNMQ